jgi:hypothetical protein
MLVKISGIWESNEQFGITYKFIECRWCWPKMWNPSR